MSIVFNGTTQYANITSAPSTSSYAFAGWFRRDTDNAAVEAWVSLDSGNATHQLLTYVTSTDGFGNYNSTGGVSTYFTPVVVGTWYWVMVRYTNGVITTRTSVDGTGAWQLNIGEIAGAPVFTEMSIGARFGSGTPQGFAPLTCGLLKVWSGAVLPTDEQLLAERTSRSAIVTTGQWATYQFRSGSLGIDASGNGRTLTQVATPTFSASIPSDLVPTTTITHRIASSGGDYTSLSSWEAAQQRNLTALDEIAVAECYGFRDTTACSINGWTTDSTRNIVIRAEPGSVARIPWSDQSYALASTDYFASLQIYEEYIRIERIQIENFRTMNNTGDEGAGIFLTGAMPTGSIYITGCHIRKINPPGVSATCAGIDDGDGYDGKLYFVNNLITGFTNGTYIRVATSGSAFIYNNTVVSSSQNGIFTFGDGSLNQEYRVMRNNLSVGNGAADYSTFTNTVSRSIFDNNASGDASAPANTVGGGTLRNRTFTFRNSANGDYRLSTNDVGGTGVGANLSNDVDYSFSVDFEGKDRNRSLLWDIGAFQRNIGIGKLSGSPTGSVVVLNPTGNRGQVIGRSE